MRSPPFLIGTGYLWALAAICAPGATAAGAPVAAASTPVPRAAEAAEAASAPVFGVAEIAFAGPPCTPSDMPARDIELLVRFRHESGSPAYEVHGFWDGDGKGGSSGNVFKVRFCPTVPGKWMLEEVRSGHATLKGQKQGACVVATPSDLKGFWTPDPDSPGRRWYKRSDGSHPFIFGNTHYSFITDRSDRDEQPGRIARDIAAEAAYFNKIRFSIHGCRYAHPTDKPFFDASGRPTDNADFSHRPNPAWFNRRVDAAVRAAFQADVIADLILSGPDTPESRSALRALENAGDPAPLLKYVAARYGSFPNVWMCLSNEWNIKSPRYAADQIVHAGKTLRRFLPYPTPVSVHGNAGDWTAALNAGGAEGGPPAWLDHVIVQGKIKTLAKAADFIAANHRLGGAAMPVIDDELGYQGEGDGFSLGDVVEGHLGALVGGGYGTTGMKPAAKKGQYFWGRFDPAEHTAAACLAWLRKAIQENVTFWKMQPVAPAESIFPDAPAGCRAMAWPGQEYVLGTSAAQADIQVRLPPGVWRVKRFDAIARQEADLGELAGGGHKFDAPASRAVLLHFKKIVAEPKAIEPPL